MICLTAIFKSKLLKRFSILVLALYSTEAFCTVAVETEREERTERVEYLETTYTSDFRSFYSDATQNTNHKNFYAFCEDTPSISRGFIVSASHKLYVLFSQWITDRWIV